MTTRCDNLAGRGRGSRLRAVDGRGVRRVVIDRRAGFTIIELAVAIVIILMLIAVMAVSLGTLGRANLTTTSGVLDGAIRYLQQLAAIQGVPYRLVIDLDQDKWWGEMRDSPDDECRGFTIADLRVEKPTGTRAEQRRRRLEEEEEEHTCPEEERDTEGRCPPTGFAAFTSSLLREHELPDRIHFSGLMTTHQQEVQESGRGYIYFFPTGRTEKAYIYLSMADETFTVETFPLLGRVRIHPEKLAARGVLDDR